MNLFAGLEKFGIKADNTTDLFEEEKKPAASANGGKTEAAPTEDSFLLDKAIRCTVCDKVFKTKMIKNGRIKRLEPDLDLRPRFEYIDTLKYDVASCTSAESTTRVRESVKSWRRTRIRNSPSLIPRRCWVTR